MRDQRMAEGVVFAWLAALEAELTKKLQIHQCVTEEALEADRTLFWATPFFIWLLLETVA